MIFKLKNIKFLTTVLMIYFLSSTYSFSLNFDQIKIFNEPNVTDDIEIIFNNKQHRNYILDLIKAKANFQRGKNLRISNYKKKHKVKIKYKNKVVKANIRITGDNYDHLDIEKKISSLRVNLIDDNISGITKFKLFLPASRNGNNEVFTTVFLEKLGFLSPYTSNVKVNVRVKGFKYSNNDIYFTQGIRMIFQEIPSKILLERSNYRDGPIIEGDERQYGENGYSKLITLCCRGKLDFSTWTKSLERQTIAGNGLTLFSHFASKGNQKFGGEHKFKLNNNSFYEIMSLLGAHHGLNTHNRKFYYDPIYNILRPIYYDGNAVIDDPNSNEDFKFDLKKISRHVIKKILAKGFVERVLEEYSKRAKKENINLKENFYTMPFGGHTSLNYDEFKLFLKRLVKKVKNAEFKSNNSIKEYSMYESLTLDNIDNSIPYSFVTFNVNSGNKFLCIKNTKFNSLKFTKISFERNKSFVCKKINSEIFVKGLKGELFYKIDYKPYKIHIETPGFLNIVNNNVNNSYDEKNNSNSQISSTKLILSQNFKKKLKSYSYVEISNKNEIKVPFNETHYIYFDKKKNFYPSRKIKIKLEKVSIGNLNKNNNYLNGRVVLIGDLSNVSDIIVKSFENKEIKNNAFLKERFTDRLLTGCITIIDSNFDNLNFDISNLSCEDSINFIRSKGQVKRLKIRNARSDAMDADFSEIIFNEVIIENSGGDCLDFSGGKYLVKSSKIYRCFDKGISVGESSYFYGRNLDITKTDIGIASKDNSIVEILDSNITNSNFCIKAYRKKQEFGGGKIFYKNLKLNCVYKNKNKYPIKDKFSTVTENKKLKYIR